MLTGGVFLPTPSQEISDPAVQDVPQGHEATRVLCVASNKELIIFPEQGLRENKHKIKLRHQINTDFFFSGTTSSRQVRHPFPIPLWLASQLPFIFFVLIYLFRECYHCSSLYSKGIEQMLMGYFPSGTM